MEPGSRPEAWYTQRREEQIAAGIRLAPVAIDHTNDIKAGEWVWRFNHPEESI